MMYLSRVEINYDNLKTMRDLAHVETFHAWVEESFPEEWLTHTRSRKLWRVDTLQGKQYLLVLSNSQPDLTKLEKYGVAHTAATKNYDSLLTSLKKGDRLQFRVALNPVISLPSEQGQDGKRPRGRVVPHVTHAQQIEFLASRAQKYGFSLEAGEFDIVERGSSYFRKSQKPIRLVKAVYQGFLTVEDVELFRNTLVNGIGKKKAYGFGMMTVIPQ